MPRKKVWEQEIRWFSRNWMRMLWCVGVKACMDEGGVDGGRGERRSVRQGYRLVKVKAMI